MFDNSSQVLAEAGRDAMARGFWPDDGPPDPDVAVRASIAAIEPVAPSVQTAAALLQVASVRPVPLDRESLEATAAPLMTLAEVESHWRTNLADGVGIRAGTQLNGSRIFAVRGPVHALRTWLADAGTDADDTIDEHGRTIASHRTYRQVSRFAQVGWTAPPSRPRSIVSYGADILDGRRQLPGDHAEKERALTAAGWLVWTAGMAWSVPGEQGRRLEVHSRRLGKTGVEVVGDGAIIPWQSSTRAAGRWRPATCRSRTVNRSRRG